MPHRRKGQKGSFGAHLEELVQKFPREPLKGPPKADEPGRQEEARHINDRLFESAWRKARKEGQKSGFSNQ